MLILSDVGFSHSLTTEFTQEIVTAVRETETAERHVEFYSESLDLTSLPGRPSLEDAEAWLAKKYGDHKLDVVVAIGPGAIRFVSDDAQPLFRDVPIVICGSSFDQASNAKLDSRFTGTWVELKPGKTLELALQLFPDTRQVIVVGGSSDFDKVAMSLTKKALSSVKTKSEIAYATDMKMNELLEKLQNLPEHSIEFYISFFQDAAGSKFLNSTKALPIIAAASNGPDFGMSDTYIGHGIVGGYVLPLEKQSKITADIVGKLLDGKQAQAIPIKTLPSEYKFDWRELQRWHIPEARLPLGSVIMFREPGLWQRTKWTWMISLLIIAVLSSITIYLQRSRKQLTLAQEKQMQLSGMLINAEEKERSRWHPNFTMTLARDWRYWPWVWRMWTRLRPLRSPMFISNCRSLPGPQANLVLICTRSRIGCIRLRSRASALFRLSTPCAGNSLASKASGSTFHAKRFPDRSIQTQLFVSSASFKKHFGT